MVGFLFYWPLLFLILYILQRVLWAYNGGIYHIITITIPTLPTET